MVQPMASKNGMILALVRARSVPIISTMAGSATTLLPMVVTSPQVPPFGLLMLLSWRLLRPELWPAWIALPLGLFDDFLSGQPLGSAMCLWTALLLTLDLVDANLVWRDYWIDWAIAAIAIILCIAGGFWFTGLKHSGISLLILLPQMVFSILCFPLVVRLCVRLDRWRLPS